MWKRKKIKTLLLLLLLITKFSSPWRHTDAQQPSHQFDVSTDNVYTSARQDWYRIKPRQHTFNNSPGINTTSDTTTVDLYSRVSTNHCKRPHLLRPSATKQLTDDKQQTTMLTSDTLDVIRNVQLLAVYFDQILHINIRNCSLTGDHLPLPLLLLSIFNWPNFPTIRQDLKTSTFQIFSKQIFDTPLTKPTSWLVEFVDVVGAVFCVWFYSSSLNKQINKINSIKLSNSYHFKHTISTTTNYRN